jgi:hypothetical protein
MKDIHVLMSKREKMENVFLGNRKLQQKNHLYLHIAPAIPIAPGTKFG